jgi:uncharacterized protein DUF3597
MSLFSTILGKLGFGRTEQPSAAAPVSTPPTPATPAPAPASTVAALSPVDVVAKLDGLAAANAQKLNWKVSIVDLLKLLDLDSSLAARKELATELGCPVDKIADSAQMNIWLHKAVLQKLAENGGNVPKELLG